MSPFSGGAGHVLSLARVVDADAPVKRLQTAAVLEARKWPNLEKK